MSNAKEKAQAKLKLGQARKYLWQFRNEDIEEFEYIDAIHYLENKTIDVIKEHINGLHNKRAGSEEYKRGYARALSDLMDLVNQEYNERDDE